MNLKFKKPSKETQMAMSKVASGEDSQDYHDLACEKLAAITNHNHAKLVNSGNSAILSAMNAIDGAILIPDQGAWNGFKQIANFLNKDLITINTHQGLIDLDCLNESLSSLSEEDMIDLNNIWPEWQVEELIGQGSYGKVYRIRRERMGQAEYAAMKLIDLTEQAILKRLNNPLSFQPIQSKRKRKYPYYRINVNNYAVFYVVIDDVMEVRRFLYSRRDIQSII